MFRTILNDKEYNIYIEDKKGTNGWFQGHLRELNKKISCRMTGCKNQIYLAEKAILGTSSSKYKNIIFNRVI